MEVLEFKAGIDPDAMAEPVIHWLLGCRFCRCLQENFTSLGCGGSLSLRFED